MTKEQFLEKYGKEEYVVVHCKTKELAKEFLQLCEDFDIKCANGNNALNLLGNWEVPTDGMYFNLNKGYYLTYGSKHSYEYQSRTVVSFEPKQKEIKNE